MQRTPWDRGNQSTVIGIVVAVVAGLVIGGFLFYRIVNGNAGKSSSSKQGSAATVPVVSSESTPSQPQPPPEADALATNRTPASGAVVPARKRENKRRMAPDATVDSQPVLLNGGAHTSTMAATANAPAPVTPTVSQTQVEPTPVRRRAVQETEAESSPVPTSTISNANLPATPFVALDRPPEPVRKPVYDGPMAGMATWTGKLGKNETLTITGGTPSTGVLAGAGLPGVPVRLIVDQTNLGFIEMPHAGNGYRRLVLKSHSGHDKITIHWTVVQQ